jgi:hypothetical protein
MGFQFRVHPRGGVDRPLRAATASPRTDVNARFPLASRRPINSHFPPFRDLPDRACGGSIVEPRLTACSFARAIETLELGDDRSDPKKPARPAFQSYS